VIIRSAFRTST